MLVRVGLVLLGVLSLAGCGDLNGDEDLGDLEDVGVDRAEIIGFPASFGPQVEVVVENYDGGIEEPFVSRDGWWLFFNSSPSEGLRALHLAAWNPVLTRFEYVGPIDELNEPGVMTGAPSMTAGGRLFFSDSRQRQFISVVDLSAPDLTVQPVRGLDLPPASFTSGWDVFGIFRYYFYGQFIWANMDVETTPLGNKLYVSRAAFDLVSAPEPSPISSDLEVYVRDPLGDENTFMPSLEYRDSMAYINTQHLEYAASISPDGLELFFTRMYKPGFRTRIMRTSRVSTWLPFGLPEEVASIPEGFVEGPTVSPDGRVLLYHREVAGGLRKLFAVPRY